MDLDRIWETVIAIVLAIAGGLARMLNKKMRLSWGRILSELFVAGFAGMMVLLFARNFGLSGDWLGLICGIAGWVGPKILDVLLKPAMGQIGIHVDKELKDSDEGEPSKEKEEP
jgi:drug/metabolite transporter (DMT)-like permease